MSDFDDLYFASRDPRVLALRSMNSPPDAKGSVIADIAGRFSQATKLWDNAKGPVIDVMIDIYGGGPELQMTYRKLLGLPWIPSFMQPGLSNPFGLGTEIPTDMSKPWPRSIKTSLDPSDYPPFAPVPAASAPAAIRPVGARNPDGTFQSNLSAVWVNGHWLFTDGSEYTQDGVKYLFHLVPGMFIPMTWWTVAVG